MNRYNLETYERDVRTLGLEVTWKNICFFLLNNDCTNPFLDLNNLAELYEKGLAIIDKNQKKEHGQYYTPKDVANLMSYWLDKEEADNVCDVACGTGSLILSYLELIGKTRAESLIKNQRLYLYDFDKTALLVCQTIILLKYGKEYQDKINIICADFLDTRIQLPKNAKVISNPPYAKFVNLKENWEKTLVQEKTKDYYACFLEKIIKQSKASVVISPYSFISSDKFFCLRQVMDKYNGEIYSFDNVPGNIFVGKKHGIFNSNKTNAVRAAITVTRSKSLKGYRLTPLIRFKNTEREVLLNDKFLKSYLSKKRQRITKTETKYYKTDKKYETLFLKWKKFSNEELINYVLPNGKYLLCVPNTCRYFTVASDKKLKRGGQNILSFDDYEQFCFAYCLMNSSFAYWWWRIYDGGITYTKGLLLKIPFFYSKLTQKQKQAFVRIAKTMLEEQEKYKTAKNNVGIQESIKFPVHFREEINTLLLKILEVNEDEYTFKEIHANSLENSYERKIH